MTDKMLYYKSGARIKERREYLGMTPEEVGRGLGVNKSTIKRYEDGVTRRITIATYEKLAEVLKTSTLYLMGEDVPPEPEKEEITENINPYADVEAYNLDLYPIPI